MKLKTSFCNPTLLKKNISRFAVVWGLFTFSLFMAFSLPLLNMDSFYGFSARDRLAFIRDLILEDSVYSGLFATQIYAVICAVACFGYLHKTRSAYMLHAFPLTRDGLFSTNLISGILFGLVPMAFIAGLNLLITASVKGAAAYILSGLAIWVLEYVFYYGLAVLCMVLTGQTVFGILCYGVFNYIFILLELVLRILAQPLLFGLPDIGIEDLVTRPLSPTVNLVCLIAEDMVPGYSKAVWGYLGIIAGAGIVLMLLAWFLYRIRHMENAGEVIAYPKLRPIFKYFFTVCVSLGLGLILTAICDPVSLSEGNGFGMLVCLLIAGLIGYFAAEMMLKRTLRVFNKKAFAGFGIFAAVLVALFCIVQFDAFGVIHRVPEADTVKYVELSNEPSNYYSAEDLKVRFDDPRDIKTVTDLHRAILDNHDRDFEEGDYVDFEVIYHLKSGIKVRRSYSGCYAPVGAEDQLEEMIDRPEILRTFYDMDKIGAAISADIVYTPYWSDYGVLNAQQMHRLADCLEADIASGSIQFYEELFYGAGDTFVLQLKGGSCVYIPASAESSYAYLKQIIPERTEDMPEEVYYETEAS